MNYALIMAGGKGTRFWPLSRLKRPKQILSIVTEKTMIEEAVSRIKPLIPLERILIITNEVQAQAIRRILPRLPKKNILAEPVGRNTAAAIGWGAMEIARRDPKASMVVLTADHFIPDTKAFCETIARALRLAELKDAPVTLGILPSYPATGYGYIKRGSSLKQVPGASHLASFHEKPSFEKAREFLARRYLWNSGMFIWKVPVILAALKKFLPSHIEILTKIMKAPQSLKKLFPQIPNISIDYGVMEKVKEAYVVEARFGWSDIGSWESLRDYWPEDSLGNATRREIIAIDAQGNLIECAPKKIVALLGVKDLAVIDTEDALLVAHKSRLQDVRRVVEALEKKGKSEVL